jgi:hypothetical protein
VVDVAKGRCGVRDGRALQVPEVPAGGAKQQQAVDRRAHSPLKSNWNSSSEEATQKARRRTGQQAARSAMMQARRPGSTITGRRDLPGRATTNRGRVRSPGAKGADIGLTE